MDLQLAQILMPDLTSSGQLQFDINTYGQRSDPNVQGQIRVVNASFATGSAPLGLQNGNGVLTLTRNRLDVTSFEGTVGGGRVMARGGVNYRPAIGFDLALTARGVRMLYPEGVRSGFGGNLTLAGTPETAYLRGQVNLQQLSFTPDFDLMSMLGQFGGTVSAPPTQGFSDNLQLDIRVSTPNGIDLASRELSLQGGMNLNVRGTATNPVIVGRMNLNDGDLIFRGNRYLLQGATIDFVNPVRTQPVVNASISTTIQQYNISMRFEGPVDSLRTSYNSDPALPPADIINLLAFGKTTEASAANPNPPGTLGAESAIAGAVAGQVTNRLQKIAGISQLSIDPTLGGSGSGAQQNPGAIVTIQQRVTSKIFVTFSTDVTGTEGQVVQLEYRLSQRLALSGTRDQNGGFAVDTRIRKNW
jgi:translocation and assembly module TamB